MDSFLDVGLKNAFMAIILAVLAACVGTLCRRPALVHGLWLLVLLKLITPPVLTFALPWPVLAEPNAAKIKPLHRDLQGSPSAAPEQEMGEDSACFPNDLLATNLAPTFTLEMPSEAIPAEEYGESRRQVVPAVVPLPQGPNDSSTIDPDVLPISWRGLMVGVWLAGSLFWLALAVIRIHRFRRVLGIAHAAPISVQEQAKQLAKRLALHGCPEVCLVPGRISPMVWWLGSRPRLFVPIDLWQDLDEEQRTTLLVHELAHVGRRDSWVRGLELVVICLYWWHPVVWWACRELHEAEEQCCDAWVIWAFPRAARAYATALLKTVDFLSETQTALPAVASGIGHVHNLRRRLTMIMRGTTPRMMSSAGLLTVLALGAFFLPLLPTWAQQIPNAPRGKEQEERQRLEALERKLEAQRAAAEAQDAGNRRSQDELAKSKAQVDLMAAQVEQAKAQLEAATRQLQLAQERLAKVEIGHRKQFLNTLGDRGQASPERRSQESDHRLREVERKLDAVLEELQNLRREIRRGGPAPAMPPVAPGAPGRNAPGERRPPSNEETPRAGTRRPATTPPASPRAPAADRPDLIPQREGASTSPGTPPSSREAPSASLATPPPTRDPNGVR